MPLGIEPFSSFVEQLAPKVAVFIIPELELELLLVFDEEFPCGLLEAEFLVDELELTLTPFDQTSLVPLFIQVNVKPDESIFCPTRVHFAPDFGAAANTEMAVDVTRAQMREVMRVDRTTVFIISPCL